MLRKGTESGESWRKIRRAYRVLKVKREGGLLEEGKQ